MLDLVLSSLSSLLESCSCLINVFNAIAGLVYLFKFECCISLPFRFQICFNQLIHILKILLGCWSCLNLNSKPQLCLFALNTSPCVHFFSSTGLISIVLPFLHLSTWPCVFSPSMKKKILLWFNSCIWLLHDLLSWINCSSDVFYLFTELRHDESVFYSFMWLDNIVTWTLVSLLNIGFAYISFSALHPFTDSCCINFSWCLRFSFAM